jgi:hypothetical protein
VVTIQYEATENTGNFLLKSITLNNEVLATQKNDITSETTLYPNPTTGRLSIDLGAVYSDININITNLLGQTISTFKKENTKNIDVAIIGDSGIYFVEVLTENNGRAFYKVVKE